MRMLAKLSNVSQILFHKDMDLEELENKKEFSSNPTKGSIPFKNVTKSGKKWVSAENQKVQNSKFGLFDKSGFSGFSQI